MNSTISKALRAPVDWLTEFAGSECCRRKIPNLTVSRSWPLENSTELVGNWLETIYARGAFNGTVLFAAGGRTYFHRYYGFTDIDEGIERVLSCQQVLRPEWLLRLRGSWPPSMASFCSAALPSWQDGEPRL